MNTTANTLPAAPPSAIATATIPDSRHRTSATTSPPPHQRRILRRAGAVLAGFATIVVASTVIDAILRAAGVYPLYGKRMSDALFALALAYRIAIAVAGSYLTARLSPGRPLADALILGTVGTVISSAGAVAMWDAGPAWYALTLIATALPCTWLGARLRLRGRAAE